MGWELTKSKLPLSEMRIYSKVAAARDKIDNSGTAPRKPIMSAFTQMEGQLQKKASAVLPLHLLEYKMTAKKLNFKTSGLSDTHDLVQGLSWENVTMSP